jgi:non-ribosomal peptide synthetase component E (peptide arylation enzyme)
MNIASEIALDRRQSVANSAEAAESIRKGFAHIAVCYTNRIAIRANGAEWTYAELDQRSSALAAQIHE